MNKISYFLGPIGNTYPEQEISILTAAEWIKTGKFKTEIDKIRSFSTKEERSPFKNKLPYFTFSGTFSYRSNAKLKEPSEAICIDYDDIDDTYRKKFKRDPHVIMVFTSPSGEGLKVVVKIPKLTDNNDHHRYYESIAKHFGIPVDPNAKDISRACYVSYDENIYINENAKTFDKVNEKEKTKESKKDERLEKFQKILIPFWVENRQLLSKDVCGFLYKLGYGYNSIYNFISDVCDKTKDEEKSMRLKSVDTTMRLDHNEVKGYSGLYDVFDMNAVLQIDKLFNLSENPKFKTDTIIDPIFFGRKITHGST